MTLRALIIGMLGGAGIAAFGYINDQILRLESIVAGHQLPVGVLGVILVGLGSLNPLLFRIRPTAALRSSELAVILVLMTASCSIPGRGLMEQFTQVLILPEHYASQNAGWRQAHVVEYVPQSMLVRPESPDSEVLTGYMRGLSEQGETVSPEEVPWGPWVAPLTTWLPVILLVGACMVCMALIVHRQWSSNERLRYPIAGFTSSVINRPENRAVPPLFRNKLFWGGVGVMVFVRLMNYAHVWWPEGTIEVPLDIDLSIIYQELETLREVPGGWYLTTVTIFPAAVAFSYFLSKEISLTLGCSELIYVAAMAFLLDFGVNVSTNYDTGGPLGWLRGGAYVALALVLLYNGRRYYGDVARAAVGRAPRGAVERHAVWALRFLVPAMLVTVGLLVAYGIPWTVAALLLGLTLVSFLGVARISAETGLFFIQPGWQAYAILVGLFGGYALGPVGLVTVGLFCAVVSIDQSMSLMPYLTNGLKIADEHKVSPGKAGGGTLLLYAAGVVLAVVVALWANYNYGMPRTAGYGWSDSRVPTTFFYAAEREIQTFAGTTGKLEASEQLGAVERILKCDPKSGFVPFLLVGLGGVLVFSLLRQMVPRWPLHPVLFLVFGTYPLSKFWFSFLLGWAIKHIVTSMFGHSIYTRTKPLWLGIIAGELLSSVLIIAYGDAYYGWTGFLPERYSFWPR